MARTATVTS
jgi:hypothetical protein